MKKYILYGFASLTYLISTNGRVEAQDIHFSQFYETSILRNPSLVGIFPKDYKFSVLYRNQWSSISKPYQTGLVTGEVRIPISNAVNDFVSIGLLGYFDKAGSIDLQTVTIYPAINYNKSLSEEHNTFLSAGFTGGYVQRSYDPGKATFDNQYLNDRFDPGNPTGENLGNPKFNYWDLGAGVTYTSSTGQNNSTNYSFGVAGYHFTRPKNSFNDESIALAVKWNVNADLTKILNEIWSFQVHANYMKQGTYNETNFGGMLGWNKKEDGGNRILFALYGGVFYRISDAFIPTLKLRYQDFNFAFSYDMNVSKLKAASNLKGGYELCITKIGWLRSPDAEKSRTICPE
jgi:type IX secretion system PorP/SprF family membrane protein